MRVERGLATSSLLDVLDRVLDKGIVIGGRHAAASGAARWVTRARGACLAEPPLVFEPPAQPLRA
jgi:hypothetical protein